MMVTIVVGFDLSWRSDPTIYFGSLVGIAMLHWFEGMTSGFETTCNKIQNWALFTFCVHLLRGEPLERTLVLWICYIVIPDHLYIKMRIGDYFSPRTVWRFSHQIFVCSVNWYVCPLEDSIALISLFKPATNITTSFKCTSTILRSISNVTLMHFSKSLESSSTWNSSIGKFETNFKPAPIRFVG